MLVNITFEVDTEDPKEATNIIKNHLHNMLNNLVCKHPAQLVTSTAETHKVVSEYIPQEYGV